MATISSSVSGNTVTYTITDQESNTCTVTAPPPGQAVVISTSGILNDGQDMLRLLLTMLVANGNSPRPQVLPNSTASFFS